MKNKNILLLGSNSHSRKMLLKDARIEFMEIAHGADEEQVDKSLDFKSLLQAIARHKMNHVIVPAGKEGDVCFVLTADSMVQDSTGIVHGKPVDRADAVQKIKALSGKSLTGTAFCLQKKRFVNDVWHTEMVKENCIVTECYLDISDDWIDRYFENTRSLDGVAGGIAVELYGSQFLQSINGSYTAILGLPMFELRQALDELGFWN
ncbi:hypothetical protein EBU24_03440 [bacterium]|nr:hypothetical protein [bacterium]